MHILSHRKGTVLLWRGRLVHQLSCIFCHFTIFCFYIVPYTPLFRMRNIPKDKKTFQKPHFVTVLGSLGTTSWQAGGPARLVRDRHLSSHSVYLTTTREGGGHKKGGWLDGKGWEHPSFGGGGGARPVKRGRRGSKQAAGGMPPCWMRGFLWFFFVGHPTTTNTTNQPPPAQAAAPLALHG